MSYKPARCPDCGNNVQMCCCQAWAKNSYSSKQYRINQTFEDWYEGYERNGEELMLFNTIDLKSAYKEGYIQGMTDGGIRDEVQFWKMVQKRIEKDYDSVPEILQCWIRTRIQRA